MVHEAKVELKRRVATAIRISPLRAKSATNWFHGGEVVVLAGLWCLDPLIQGFDERFIIIQDDLTFYFQTGGKFAPFN